MGILQWIGIGVLVLLVALAVLSLRRALVVRKGGTIVLYLRLSTLVTGRGWAPGFARFVPDELRWYRMFSFALRPRRVLARRGLAVDRRRRPSGPEQYLMPSDWVIVRCTGHQAPIEIAMSPSTEPGFRSWIEASPPGGEAALFRNPVYPPITD